MLVPLVTYVLAERSCSRCFLCVASFDHHHGLLGGVLVSPCTDGPLRHREEEWSPQALWLKGGDAHMGSR